MESNSSGERFLQGHATDVADNEVRSQDAVIGGTTIYLVVFKDGICSVRLQMSLSYRKLNERQSSFTLVI